MASRSASSPFFVFAATAKVALSLHAHPSSHLQRERPFPDAAVEPPSRVLPDDNKTTMLAKKWRDAQLPEELKAEFDEARKALGRNWTDTPDSKYHRLHKVDTKREMADQNVWLAGKS